MRGIGLIATDGVFSDGWRTFAPSTPSSSSAERYRALVMVDDSHAVGFMGPTGAGTPELFGVQDRVDIVDRHVGESARRCERRLLPPPAEEIVEMLRQRSRPYLFSNSLAPSIAAAGIATLDLLETSAELLQRLRGEHGVLPLGDGCARLRDSRESDHPIVPIMIGDAVEAAALADRLLGRGHLRPSVLVPSRTARQRRRIRTQMSAAHYPR